MPLFIGFQHVSTILLVVYRISQPSTVCNYLFSNYTYDDSNFLQQLNHQSSYHHHPAIFGPCHYDQGYVIIISSALKFLSMIAIELGIQFAKIHCMNCGNSKNHRRIVQDMISKNHIRIVRDMICKNIVIPIPSSQSIH